MSLPKQDKGCQEAHPGEHEQLRWVNCAAGYKSLWEESFYLVSYLAMDLAHQDPSGGGDMLWLSYWLSKGPTVLCSLQDPPTSLLFILPRPSDPAVSLTSPNLVCVTGFQVSTRPVHRLRTFHRKWWSCLWQDWPTCPSAPSFICFQYVDPSRGLSAPTFLLFVYP